jgi:transcriptional regulator with XRE-family HTH domain
MLRIKELRNAAGLSQQTLARRSGLTQPCISYLESHRVKRGPQRLTALKLTLALGCSLEDLYGSTDGASPVTAGRGISHAA